MSDTKQFYYRFLILVVFISLFSLSAACTNNDPEEKEFDFGSENQQPVPNQFEGGREEQKPGGVKDGLQLTKVSGHKWTLIYTHATQSAELKVSIVSWDENRYTLTDIHYNCSYIFDQATPAGAGGSGVMLELDSIQSNIQDCYNRSGVNPQFGSVPAVELYPSVQFEVIGEWEKPGAGVLAHHESFEYLTSGDTLFLSADNDTGTGSRAIQSESRPFSAKGPFHAASNFEFWQSLNRSPQGEISYVEHYVWDSSGKVTDITPKNGFAPDKMSIILARTEMLIDPPAGFLLDTLIVDPKNWGTGGG